MILENGCLPKQIKTEKDVKKKIIQPWLDSLGAWQFMPVPCGFGLNGVPDHIAGVPVTITPEMVGMTVAVLVAPEAKAPDKRRNTSEKQKEQMSKIDEIGGITGVISCEDDKDLMWLRIINLTEGMEND